MSLFETLQSIAALATAIGVVVAAVQLRTSKKQALTQFEDTLSRQYRNVIREIPVDALLGKKLSPEMLASALPAFYGYFDLSNEQAFLHRKGRVTIDTWNEWMEGIRQNLQRPAFAEAWLEVSENAVDSFDDLRSVLRSEPS